MYHLLFIVAVLVVPRYLGRHEAHLLGDRSHPHLGGACVSRVSDGRAGSRDGFDVACKHAWHAKRDRSRTDFHAGAV